MDIGELTGTSAVALFAIKEVFNYLKSRKNGNGKETVDILNRQTEILSSLDTNSKVEIEILRDIKSVNSDNGDKLTAVGMNLNIAMERQQQMYQQIRK